MARRFAEAMMREARPPERGDFRRRCEAALAHPVTLIALAALLVNDIVLKALFPGAWAMGKLSDLAWMTFAPPLLAFALSFAVPKRSAAGRRAALIVAYGGLPLLYAAFNTFAPVHDAIIRALLIGAESGALGSPMDATDSLVIPFALALAIWARRRSAESGGGGTRARLGILVAGIAAFASVATSYPDRVDGVTSIGVTNDGTVAAASSNFYGDIYGGYISEDGGMSWSPHQTGEEEAVNYEETIWSSQSVNTPRGEYAITGSGIERVGEGGERELVYSTRYLRGDASEWMQEQDTQNFAYRLLATRPGAIIYHAESGNLIAAMGIQGVVVETPDGVWHRVAVGRYSPTDFSFSAKTRALSEHAGVIFLIALALSLSALTVAAAASDYERQEYKGDRDKDTAFIILTALGGGLMAVVMSAVLNFIPIAAAALLAWISAIIAAVKSKGPGQWRFAALSCVSASTLAIALLASFGISENNCCSYTELAKFILTFAAFIALVPPFAYYGRFIARRFLPFALAFLGMNALIILSFAMWLTLNLGLIATQMAIAILVGLAAVVLVRHVRSAGAGGW